MPDNAISEDLINQNKVTWYSHITNNGAKLTRPTKVIDQTNLRSLQNTQSTLSGVYYATDQNGIITDRIFASSPQSYGHDSDLSWAATTKDVRLRWKPQKGVTQWDIYRSNKKIGSTRSNEWVDLNANRQKDLDYAVIGVEKRNQIDLLGVTIPALTADPLGKEISDRTLQEAGFNSDLFISKSNQTATRSMRETQLAYNTFISEKRIPVPPVCTEFLGKQFSGDGRSFANTKIVGDYERLSSRGQNLAYLSWINNNADLDEVDSRVGETRVYDGDKIIARKTADKSGLKTTKFNFSKGRATLRFVQDIGNPLCSLAFIPAAHIDVDIKVTIENSTGNGIVKGTHDGAPNHEVLLTHITSSGKGVSGCLYNFRSSDFIRLAPGLPVKVDVTMNQGGVWGKNCPIYKPSNQIG